MIYLEVKGSYCIGLPLGALLAFDTKDRCFK
jgi:hypothetical protein